MLGEIVSALSLWDRLVKAYRQINRQKETVASRFVKLFEAHGVHRNQIPRFFGHGLTAANVENDARLLECLDEVKLNAASELFAVRREWLDGVTPTIYDTKSFYKDPESFLSFIEQLKAQSSQISGRLLIAHPKSKTRLERYDSLLVIEEFLDFVGAKPIYRYHLCDPLPFNYWKCRGHIAACIAIACRHGVYIHGDHVHPRLLSYLTEGEQFLKVSEFGGLSRYGNRWEPENLALNPNDYLAGIDEGRFGKISALRKWLELGENGWMNTGIASPSSRESFEIALKSVKLESSD